MAGESVNSDGTDSSTFAVSAINCSSAVDSSSAVGNAGGSYIPLHLRTSSSGKIPVPSADSLPPPPKIPSNTGRSSGIKPVNGAGRPRGGFTALGQARGFVREPQFTRVSGVDRGQNVGWADQAHRQHPNVVTMQQQGRGGTWGNGKSYSFGDSYTGYVQQPAFQQGSWGGHAPNPYSGRNNLPVYIASWNENGDGGWNYDQYSGGYGNWSSNQSYDQYTGWNSSTRDRQGPSYHGGCKDGSNTKDGNNMWNSGNAGRSNETDCEKSHDADPKGVPVFDRDNTGINFDAYDDIPVEVSGMNVPLPVEGFDDLQLHASICENIRRCKYTRPTPVQKYAIPICLAVRDLMACAQTGSGKTAAFCFPIIEGILRNGVPDRHWRPLALVVAPTRELAQQIADEAVRFAYQTGVKIAVVYGGTRLQNRSLEHADILVATPGRLNDLIARGSVELNMIRYLVLDEADRMLDMGFEPQIRRIVDESDMPPSGSRQTLMFSATFPPQIQKLASDFMRNYVFLTVGKVGSSTELIEQKVMFVEEREKRDNLMELLGPYGRKDKNASKTLVFVETKRGADDLESWLCSKGYSALAIHGDKSQPEREHALKSFKAGFAPILVATAVASRGLDIADVALVVNFDMPLDVDDYVHRIGRTGRAGKKGLATAFFCEKDIHLAKPLMDILQGCSQEVPEWLKEHASRTPYNSEFRRYSRESKNARYTGHQSASSEFGCGANGYEGGYWPI